MIIDPTPLTEMDALEFKVEITLTDDDGEERAHFKFEAPFSEVFTRILEVDDFALNFMAYHGCNLHAETKVEPLGDK